MSASATQGGHNKAAAVQGLLSSIAKVNQWRVGSYATVTATIGERHGTVRYGTIAFTDRHKSLLKV